MLDFWCDIDLNYSLNYLKHVYFSEFNVKISSESVLISRETLKHTHVIMQKKTIEYEEISILRWQIAMVLNQSKKKK